MVSSTQAPVSRIRHPWCEGTCGLAHTSNSFTLTTSIVPAGRWHSIATFELMGYINFRDRFCFDSPVVAYLSCRTLVRSQRLLLKGMFPTRHCPRPRQSSSECYLCAYGPATGNRRAETALKEHRTMAERLYRTLARRTVDRFPVNGKDAVLRDRDLPGFGVGVYSSGKKVFVVHTRASGRSKCTAERQHDLGQVAG